MSLWSARSGAPASRRGSRRPPASRRARNTPTIRITSWTVFSRRVTVYALAMDATMPGRQRAVARRHVHDALAVEHVDDLVVEVEVFGRTRRPGCSRRTAWRLAGHCSGRRRSGTRAPSWPTAPPGPRAVDDLSRRPRVCRDRVRDQHRDDPHQVRLVGVLELVAPRRVRAAAQAAAVCVARAGSARPRAPQRRPHRWSARTSSLLGVSGLPGPPASAEALGLAAPSVRARSSGDTSPERSPGAASTTLPAPTDRRSLALQASRVQRDLRSGERP